MKLYAESEPTLARPTGIKYELQELLFVQAVNEACTFSSDAGHGTFNKIKAIKIMRAYPHLALGLKEAKDLVEFVYENKQLFHALSILPPI